MRGLRVKIIAATMFTCVVIALTFGTILYPFEMSRRHDRLEGINLLLSSVFQQVEENLANEIFAGQRAALKGSMAAIQKVQGVKAVSLYSLSGALLLSSDDYPSVVLSESEMTQLNAGKDFSVEDRRDASLAVLSSVIEAIGERVGYIRIYFDLTELARESTLNIIFFGALLLSMVLVTSFFLNMTLYHAVIQPVRKLRDAMLQVREGNLGECVELSSSDEIGDMAAVFNEMSTRLKEQHDALTNAIRVQDSFALRVQETNRELEKMNAGLEGMVAERTRELLESNRKLKEEIVERSRAEAALAAEKERLTVTLGSIGEGVITTDTEGRIDSLNREAALLTGWTRERAVSRPINEVFRLSGRPVEELGEHPVHKALAGGAIISPANPAVLSDENGRERVVTYSVAPIRNRESRVMGAVVVFRDVTLQKKLEQDYIQSAKLESLGVLAGGIAHDFNNILTAILGNLSLARLYSDPGGPISVKLGEAEKAAFHAKGLTQQLLTFSKGGAPVKTTTTIEALLVDTVNFAMSGSNAKCRFSLDSDLWPLEIDPSQISQVINNLVINAYQAMPEGGEIVVGAANRLVRDPGEVRGVVPGKYVVIWVRDQGPGVSEELREKIFDPYFTTKEKGSGLGLSTCYSVVKKHGGFIDLSSDPGAGATFRVFLPAADRRSDPEKKEDDRGLAPGCGRILLMDDEEKILEVTREALTFLGYEVETARDGAETIEKYSQALQEGRGFDVVIMDLTIPGGVGGQAALNELRKLDPEIQAVVSSGYSQDPVMARHREFGFRGVLPKPFRLEELSRVLAGLMRK
ncbi:MAG: ATP-binding protein [Pseudomonadota bacterium]